MRLDTRAFIAFTFAFVTVACSNSLGATGEDGGPGPDLGGSDSGSGDSGNPGLDANVPDGTFVDSSTPDMGAIDMDGGGVISDAGSVDLGPPLVADYYVAPDGNDSNPGTMEAPFATWDHLSEIGMAPGQLAYIRGGVYHTPYGAGSSFHAKFEDMHGTDGNPIRIWAYPGEHPVLDLDTIDPSATDPHGLLVLNCTYVHFKGLRITRLKQVLSGAGISRGVTIHTTSDSVFEYIESDNIGGVGFKLENSHNNHLLNCDAHNNGDGRTDEGADAWDNSDGFSVSGGDSSSGNIFEGCRAWLNSDDGWDFFGTDGTASLINCWAFWNGYKPWGPTSARVDTPTVGDPSVFRVGSAYVAGNGEGFKLGPAASPDFDTVFKVVTGCIGFENRSTGFNANSPGSMTRRMELNNNAAFGNNNDGFLFGAGFSPGVAHTFHNNWAYDNNRVDSGGGFVYDGLLTNVSHNAWNLPVTVDASDFESISSLGVDGARAADGGLPSLSFLHLVAGSDLLNVGLDVGLPFTDSAPDLGPFER